MATTQSLYLKKETTILSLLIYKDSKEKGKYIHSNTEVAMKMWALHTLNSSLSGTVKGRNHPCKDLNVPNPELDTIIYWQVHKIPAYNQHPD